MAIKAEIKRRAKQPTTQAGALALLIAPQIMPDVDWDAVIGAIQVLYEQLPIMVAAIGGLAIWNVFKDEDKDAESR
jgi:hypothetical protein